MAARKDHGFWPYLVPYFVAYLFLVELGGRTPPEFAGYVLALKAVVPLGLVFHYFASQGAYPELRGYSWRPSEVGLDFLVLGSVALSESNRSIDPNVASQSAANSNSAPSQRNIS